MPRILVALVAGLLFGPGLTVSGMINPNKVLGPPDEVERYRRVFGTAGMKVMPVAV